jgi:hypothetical protein
MESMGNIALPRWFVQVGGATCSVRPDSMINLSVCFRGAICVFGQCPVLWANEELQFMWKVL